MRFDRPRIDVDRSTKLLHRLVDLTAICIQHTQIVADLRARIAVGQERPVLGKRPIEVTRSLVLERPLEMISGFGARWRAAIERRMRGRGDAWPADRSRPH